MRLGDRSGTDSGGTHCEQGMDLVLVPLDASFRHRAEEDQRRIRAALQACATTAGIDGTVVAVWGGREPSGTAPLEWTAVHLRWGPASRSYAGSATQESGDTFSARSTATVTVTVTRRE